MTNVNEEALAEPEADPEAGHWVMGLRRSTILIAIGVVLAVATLATVLTVVQRVQTDPRQLGATQIARLSVDTGYEIPLVFGSTLGLEDPPPVQAYQSFHGLRVLMNSELLTGPKGPSDTCMTIYPEATIQTTPHSFDGVLFAGCSAGQFPAIVQFTVDTYGLPAELRSAFPDSSGLQFVYDADHDEVVFFSDR